MLDLLMDCAALLILALLGYNCVNRVRSIIRQDRHDAKQERPGKRNN